MENSKETMYLCYLNYNQNYNQKKKFQSPTVASVENLSCEISAYQSDDGEEVPLFISSSFSG